MDFQLQFHFNRKVKVKTIQIWSHKENRYTQNPKIVGHHLWTFSKVDEFIKVASSQRIIIVTSQLALSQDFKLSKQTT